MINKTKLDIPLLLPQVPDSRDKCVVRLADLLQAKEGIDTAHALEADEDHPDQICIHYDPRLLTISEVREMAKRAGMTLHDRFGHLLLKTEPVNVRRARTLTMGVKQIKGVLEAALSPLGILRIEFDREITNGETIRTELPKKDIRIIEERPAKPESTEETHEHGHGSVFGDQTELIFAVICGGLLFAGWLLSLLPSVTPWAPWAFFLGAYIFGGYFTAKEAVESILAKSFEIDFLMLVAAIGAAVLGAWAEGALLLFLFSLGHALEHYAMGRARRAIEALAKLAPEFALVRRDGSIVQLPIDKLVRGDIVVVKPNERLPADGFVVKGESSVNQAPITGESVPVDKLPVDDPRQAAQDPGSLAAQHLVFAGTINESGALEVQVTRLSTESTLARVVQMVNEAETHKSPTQRFTDKFERYFVPAVLTLVVLLLFGWIVIDEPFSASFYRAMAVLVAASPCALAISTPSAVLSGIARAARGGVLVKGGGPLENLGRLGAIAFDKTGTLTEGKPRLTDVVAYNGVADGELLRIAIAVEGLSDHPLAAAVVRDGKERLESEGTPNSESQKEDAPSERSTIEIQLPDAHDLQSITGRGVKATVDGHTVHIGKDDLFAEIDDPPLPDDLRQSVETLESEGRTTMIVRYADRYLGVLGVMDTPRDASRKVIDKLRELGVKRMIMISGDNQQVADAVAKKVGIDEAWGDLMPDDKVASIRKLRQQEEVAMVGDGVNDAPAMANATVGIAMGAAGSDVALETADVALMADDLSHLPFAVGLSRQTSRIIRQNLWFSLGMVALLVPATILGLRMGAAVLFHEGSTLLVVFNALRLLSYGDVQGARQISIGKDA